MARDADARIRVEVAYALPQVQVIVPVEVEEGATIRQAVVLSGLLSRYPELDANRLDVGIFSKPADLDTPLRAGDRVEIYRPLIADPKEVRKRRARTGA